MTVRIVAIVFTYLICSCGNTEHKNEFQEMKSELEDAAKAYCECMAKADTTDGYETEVCQEILHDKMINKCGENEFARDFIHDEIQKCILERRGDVE